MGGFSGPPWRQLAGRLFASVPERGWLSGFVAFALTMGREGEVTPVGTNGQRPWMFCAPKDSDLDFCSRPFRWAGAESRAVRLFLPRPLFLNRSPIHRGCSLQTPDGRDPSFSGRRPGRGLRAGERLFFPVSGGKVTALFSGAIVILRKTSEIICALRAK